MKDQAWIARSGRADPRSPLIIEWEIYSPSINHWTFSIIFVE